MKITKLDMTRPAEARKVCAYARVSVKSDILLHSLANQVSYYTTLIEANPNWELVEIYTDEGITGTSIAHRDQFQKMMEDARDGKFDLIITKSVSRFARNTVDLLESCRDLKKLNVEVQFEKDHLSTFNSEGELMLSLLATFAQAESQSISQNVKWSKQKQMQQGIYHHFSRCYGYEWQDDEYTIVDKEAEVVRFIYQSYLAGLSPTKIARQITAKTVKGKEFTRGTVKDILKNRIYVGDRTLQRYYSDELRTHHRNYGQRPKYILKETHEPIIDRQTFEQVQELREQKAKETPPKTFSRLTGKVKCGYCGSAFCRATSHDKKVWKCQGKAVRKNCSVLNIDEDELYEKTEALFNEEVIEKIMVFDDCLQFVFSSSSRRVKR